MGGHLRAACAALLCASLSGCAASIASRAYDRNSAQDGIVYRLPATEIVLTATYELKTCTPGLSVELVGVTVASRLVPSSSDDDAYVIDPEALHTPLGSVGPARVEMRNGMLASVGITTTSDVGALVGLAAKTASILAGRPAASAHGGNCTERATTALEARRVAKAEVTALEAALASADARFRANPSEDLERLVTRLDTQITAAQAAVRTIRDTQLRRSVQFVCIPVIERGTRTRLGLQCDGAAASWSTAANPSIATEITLSPSAHHFRAWTTETTPADENARIRWREFTGNLGARLALVAAPAPGTGFAERPDDDERRDGVFYRRPAAGFVAVIPTNVNAAAVAIDPTPISLPQFGQLSFLEMRGARIGGRSIAVAFDETGAIKTYEYTSSGAAREIMTATAEAAQTLQQDEVAELQREIDILTRRRQLIEAQEALDEAMSSDADD